MTHRRTHICVHIYIHTNSTRDRPKFVFEAENDKSRVFQLLLFWKTFTFRFWGIFLWFLVQKCTNLELQSVLQQTARFTSVTKNLRLLAVIFTEESASNWAFVSDMNTCNVLENAGGCPDLRHSRLNIWTSAVPLTMQWESANLSFATNIRIGIIFRLATVAVLISSTDNRF